MEKKLSEMSLEELWKLFPIYLTEHQPYWKEWYTDEGKHSKKCTFYTLRFGCSFAAVNTIKPQLL